MLNSLFGECPICGILNKPMYRRLDGSFSVYCEDCNNIYTINLNEDNEENEDE